MLPKNCKVKDLFEGPEKITQKSSKERLEKFLRHILGNSNFKLIKKNDSDFIEIYSLLEFHPNFKNKTRYGISAFIINITPKDYVQLSLIDDRGEKDDVSWVKISQVIAGEGFEKLKMQSIYKAMRLSIVDQILDFKKAHFQENHCFISELSGKKIDPNFVHVDHFNPTFCELANSWIDLIGFENIETVSLGYQLGSVLKKGQKENWANYHKKHAKLRILSAKENLTRKKSFRKNR